MLVKTFITTKFNAKCTIWLIIFWSKCQCPLGGGFTRLLYSSQSHAIKPSMLHSGSVQSTSQEHHDSFKRVPGRLTDAVAMLSPVSWFILSTPSRLPALVRASTCELGTWSLVTSSAFSGFLSRKPSIALKTNSWHQNSAWLLFKLCSNSSETFTSGDLAGYITYWRFCTCSYTCRSVVCTISSLVVVVIVVVIVS